MRFANLAWAPVERRLEADFISPVGPVSRAGELERSPAWVLEDVVAELLRLEHGNAPTARAHDAGTLEIGEEATDALA